jgi:hypothetical protein
MQSATGGERSRYRLSLFYRIFYPLFALVLIAAGGLFIYEPIAGDRIGNWGLLVVGVAVVLAGIYTGAIGLFSYVALGDDFVTLNSFFFSRAMRRQDIQGFRTDVIRNRIVIESNDPRGRNVSISRAYRFDDRWRNWMATLTDLDRREG